MSMIGTVSTRGIAPNFTVKVNGSALSSEIAPHLVRAEAETSLRMPAMFTMWLTDPEHKLTTTFPMGAAVEVTVADAFPVTSFLSEPDKVFTGEVVAIEARRLGNTSYTVIRCYDKSHRLYRGRKTRGFLQKKYSDIVRQVAGEHGITVGVVEDAPGAAVHEFIGQHDESDGELVERFAAEYGFVLQMWDGRLDFKAPPNATTGPSPGRFGGAASEQLVLGDDLSEYEVALSSESLVSNVEVRSWDRKNKREIVGVSPVTAAIPTALVPGTPAAASAPFGAATYTSSAIPVNTMGEANHVAKAIANQIAGTFAHLQGTSLGNPKLRAGVVVSIGPTGNPFSGKYVITSARHRLADGGYHTELACAGLSDIGLGGTTGAAELAAATEVPAPMPGVMIGVVTNNKDPDNLGRVKVKLPHMAASLESGWLRVVSPGIGTGRGFVALPEVNDEVLIAFEKGDIRHGYVLGGLYNGMDKPTQRSFPTPVASDGKVNRRAFTSRTGHHVVFSDENGKEYIELQTGDEKILLKMDKTAGTLTLHTEGGKAKVMLDKTGNITVEGQGKIEVKATQDLTLEGMNVKITAKQALELKGTNSKIEGTASLAATSTGQAKFEGAAATFSGTATAELKAPMVRIN